MVVDVFENCCSLTSLRGLVLLILISDNKLAPWAFLKTLKVEREDNKIIFRFDL